MRRKCGEMRCGKDFKARPGTAGHGLAGRGKAGRGMARIFYKTKGFLKMGKPHLSPSSLGMITRCPAQYEWRYVRGIKSAPSIALIIGGATHVSVEKDLTAKMTTGVLLTDQEVENNADAAFTTKLAEEQESSGHEIVFDEEADLGTAKDLTVDLATLHHIEHAPNLAPIAIEREVVISVDGYPYDLMGFIDVQEQGKVRDTKTKGNTPPATAMERDIQFTFYSMAVQINDKCAAPDCYMDNLVKLKKPKLVILNHKYEQGDYDQLSLRFGYAAKMIEAGMFPPCDPSSWVCSSKFCGYFAACSFGRKKVVSVPVEADF